MSFWEMAYRLEWADKALLKQAVLTESNPFGEITEEEYKGITGEVYAA